MSKYESPELRDLGSLSKLTEGSFDKVGSTVDAASQSIPGLDGSVVPDP